MRKEGLTFIALALLFNIHLQSAERAALTAISPFARAVRPVSYIVQFPVVGTLSGDKDLEFWWQGHGEELQHQFDSPFSNPGFVTQFYKDVPIPDGKSVVLRQFVLTEVDFPAIESQLFVKLDPTPLAMTLRSVPVAKHEKPKERRLCIAAAFTPRVKYVDLSIRTLGSGWMTISKPRNPRDWLFLHTPVPITVSHRNGETSATVPGNCRHDSLRMVCISRDRKISHPTGIKVDQEDGAVRTHFIFEGARGEGERFELQENPVRRITFKDVALTPNRIQLFPGSRQAIEVERVDEVFDEVAAGAAQPIR